MEIAIPVAAGVSIATGSIYLIRKLREYSWGWCKNKENLAGKVFIVTGANVGLGFETTKGLLRRGAVVVMACRSEQKANEAIAQIRREISEGEVDFIELDLGDFSSIRRFSARIKEKYPDFCCLINNAGVASRKQETTCDGLELHMATNHLGHYLLTRTLWANIAKNKSRVVIVSSKLHEKGVIDFDGFGQLKERVGASKKRTGYYDDSKLMNFYFAKELYERDVDCHVLCPGLCFTNLFRDFEPKFYHYILLSPFILWFLRSAEQGAQNILHCALDNVNDAEKNPSNSYLVMNLKQTKSKIKLDSDVSKRLWLESAKLCGIDES